ncbi:hypothetical protein DSO57_1015959 [Entomophthora muscae]|uniref:Uncharacterized protein n=1 Tax=Entomophthora muscae TaxID=34485 RepID=A0ACC2T5B1_9FUNG|nr:hypothetical protein DSO57_1015959 [Entomophthora muscae]
MGKKSNKVTAQSVGSFEGLKVLTPKGKSVLLSDTWQRRPVVLKVLARLGCAMCRYEAKAMSELQPFLEERGVGLVAVAFEDVDLEEFLKCGYWKWDILVDPNRHVYQAAGLLKMTLGQTLMSLFSKQTNRCLSRLSSLGFSYNLRGDMRQLGGTFVINPNGSLLYQFRPSRMAMFPCTRDIILAIGGDPDDVEDDLLPEFVFPSSNFYAPDKSSYNLPL